MAVISFINSFVLKCPSFFIPDWLITHFVISFFLNLLMVYWYLKRNDMPITHAQIPETLQKIIQEEKFDETTTESAKKEDKHYFSGLRWFFFLIVSLGKYITIVHFRYKSNTNTRWSRHKSYLNASHGSIAYFTNFYVITIVGNKSSVWKWHSHSFVQLLATQYDM